MLLECDLCGNAFSRIMKVPCAYYIEVDGDKFTFIMPNDETAYRNICLNCIIGNSEKEI